MKSIRLLVSGLFIVGTLLWLRAATHVASTAISADGDLGVWKRRTTVSNTKGIVR